MRVRFGGVRETGRAVDLRRNDDVDVGDVLAAVRDPTDERVRCPPPGPVHEHVGHLHEGMALSRRSALVAAARSRGIDTPQDVELVALESVSAPVPPDPTAARRRVAEADAEVTTLRERVERLGGRVEARRALDAPTEHAKRRYRAAVRALAVAETERVAAEQALDRAHTAVERAREARQAALRATDRRRNARRAAHEHLLDTIADSFELALRSVPGDVCATSDSSERTPFSVALAVARVARVRAPVVVECGESSPFDRPARAAACLDAPVLFV